MVISEVILATGLGVRFSKLFEGLSISITTRIRDPFSTAMVRFLSRVHAWSRIQESPTGLKRLLVYQVLLAVFLLIRVAVDFICLCLERLVNTSHLAI